MIHYTQNCDINISRQVQNISKGREDFWSFKGNAQRDYGHGLLQYPAMMVPQLVRAILKVCCNVHPEIDSVGDPFVGSGTVLTETMLKGLRFWGTDINPLSILSSMVKKGPFFSNELQDKSNRLVEIINRDSAEDVEISFKGINKWFEPTHQIALSKIKRSILKEEELWARRFFWLTLAETVRYTSNSRTSTYKLHIRTPEEIKNRAVNATNLFKRYLDRNISLISSLENSLNSSMLLENGKYKKEISLHVSDIREYKNDCKSDIIITSPPYGDNQTTVPYGQYSYLPLQWIDLGDIDDSLTRDFLNTTHNIDTVSLGGHRIKFDNLDFLRARSSSLSRYLEEIEGMPADCTARVSSFFYDFDNSIPLILSHLNQNGLLVFVLGNRKVGGKRVPFDKILVELMDSYGVKLIHKLQRDIPSKRMASKNRFAETMSKESIIFLRKSEQI